jgi:hypothetical protein
MSLPRVDAAFETCEKHLVETGALNTEVDSILTSYLCTVIYAAMEQEARRIVAERAAQGTSDQYAARFVRAAVTRLVRSIKVSELAGAVGIFDPGCKVAFHDGIDSEMAAAWDNILLNRHGVAHEDGQDDDEDSAVSHMTFRELQGQYQLALQVLDALAGSVAWPLVGAADSVGAPDQ